MVSKVRPEVLYGVRTVRPPSLGKLRCDCDSPVVAEQLEGVPDAEIRRQERVRVTQRTHRDVTDGPRPDSRHVVQLSHRLVAVRADIKGDLAGSQCSRKPEHAPPSSLRHRQLPWVSIGKCIGAGEQPIHSTDWLVESLAVRRDEPAGQRGRCRKRDLLAEHGSDGQLVTVDVTRDASPGRCVNQASEHGVGAE
jgi:hypothetical protein